MEIGAWVGNNGPATPAHMLSVAQTADRTGLASVWAADHILWPVEYASRYPYGGDKYPADFNQPVAECITTMTWLSVNTKRVKVGSLVIVVPQRNPWLLARQLATIDVFNGGRTILGAGTGWLREEFEALGMPFERRFGRTEEAIALMRTIWTEHPVRFRGKYFGAEPMGVLPHPPHGPIPVWLGGNTRGAIERVGRLGEGWIPYGLTPAELAVGWDDVRRAAEDAGRDPSTITCSLWAPITVSRPGAPLPPEGLPLQGPPALLVERLAEYSQAGLQHFVMFNFCPAEATAEQVELIATEVLPHVKSFVGRGAA